MYEAEHVRETFGTIVGSGNVTELRAINVTSSDTRWPHVVSGYFNGPEKLIAALKKIKTASGIYIVPNPIDFALMARAENRVQRVTKGGTTQDKDVLKRKWLFVDVDPQRPSGVSSSDQEHELAIQRTQEIRKFLQDQGWPLPILADSGNGGHLLFRIDLPVDDSELVQKVLTALAQQFDCEKVKIDPSVCNPARLVKLYGTWACKGDDTNERPHRIAHILEQPDELEVVPPERLQGIAAEPEAKSGILVDQTFSSANSRSFDLDSFISQHNLLVDGPFDWQGNLGAGRKWVFRSSPMCEHDDRAAYLIEHANEAISAGCQHASCSWNWTDLRRKFEKTCKHSAPVSPQSAEGKQLAQSGDDGALCSRSGPFGPVLVRLEDVNPEQIQWLWPGRIPLGKLTLLAGDPGLGKSLLSLDVAARVTRGAPWPDEREFQSPAGGVVLLSAEDDVADTIRPRLDAAGADVTKIYTLQAISPQPDTGQHQRPVDLGGDLHHVETAIRTIPNCRLVIIDPLSAYLGSADSHRNTEIRGLLGPLADLAAQQGVAVLAITHLRKGEGPAIYRSTGSIAFVAAARAVWVVAQDKEDPERRLFLPLKNNLSSRVSGLAYRIDETPTVIWESDPVTASADEALAWDSGPNPKSAISEATAWLREALAEGEKPATKIKDDATAAGIASRTLDRAKIALKVIARPSSFGGPWSWRLPDAHTVRQNLPVSPQNASAESPVDSGETAGVGRNNDETS